MRCMYSERKLAAQHELDLNIDKYIFHYLELNVLAIELFTNNNRAMYNI